MAALTDVDVREVQELLNLNGYSAGPVDGVVGPRTTGAIRAYQSDYDLEATGRPSFGLLRHLRAVTSGEMPLPGALQASGSIDDLE
jgi:peptidoglycan hydrolase-like protein with peptidoglycan-binding domain